MREAGLQGPLGMRVHGVAVLLGALLLFLVQPMMGKAVLPLFGGGAATWTACLLFFQAALLLGYAYAHLLVRHLSPARQFLVHAALLALALASLPPAGRPQAWSGPPVLGVLVLLGRSVGLPFVALAATGPLLQAWLGRGPRTPYRLYAVSNLGSLGGLLAYPFLVEPFLALVSQVRAWSVGFGLWAALVLLLAWRHRHGVDAEEEAWAPPPEPGRVLHWILLATCPSLLLAAITAHVTANVAPVPLLWVLPLALYLLSFVLCFEGAGLRHRGPVLLLALGTLLAALLLAAYSRSPVNPLLQAPVAFGALFLVALACHGELARLKPHPHRLTAFYLALAAGGALGGALAGVAAPALLSGRGELFAGAMLFALLVVFGPGLEREGLGGRRLVLGLAGGLLAVAALLWTGGTWPRPRIALRNFYGTVRVTEQGSGPEARLAFVDGAILHGTQFLDPARRRWPTTYFGREAGVGLAFEVLQRQGPLKVGVVGLGAGTLAAYGRPGDHLRFYELNPAAVRLAEEAFTYLRDCPAHLEVLQGDARLVLQGEPSQGYDLLVMDAFTGDAIPVHLVTLEALELYQRHLKPEGLLAINVSNRFLDLAPGMVRSGRALGMNGLLVERGGSREPGCVASRWLLLSSDPRRLPPLKLLGGAAVPAGAAAPWTDAHSALWGAVKF